MKKIHILLLLLIPIVLGTGNSCKEHEVVYPNQGNSPNAAFAKGEINQEIEVADGGTYKVEIVRGNLLETEATIGITLTTGKDVPAETNFRLAENSVLFAKGENRKEVAILYNIEAMELFNKYPIILSFTDPLQGPIFNANATVTVNFTRKLLYEDIGDGIFTSSFFDEEDLGANPKTVKVQQAEGGAPYFWVKDMYVNGYDIKFILNKDLTAVVEFENQITGLVHSTYGMISAQLMESSISGNTIILIIRYYVNAGRFGDFRETLLLPQVED